MHINGNPFKGLTKSEIIETMLDPTIYYFTCDLDNPTLTDLLDTLEYHRSK